MPAETVESQGKTVKPVAPKVEEAEDEADLAAAEAAELDAMLAKKELEEEKTRERERILACEAFKGRTFDAVVLVNGEELKNVKVTSADAIGVSFMYEHGIKRVPFTNLSEDIREACKYDPDAAERRQKLEEKARVANLKEMRAQEKLRRERKRNDFLGVSDDSVATNSGEFIDSNSNAQKAVRPRGNVSVSVTSVNHGSYKYYRGQKGLKIKAIANVPAYLEYNGATIYILEAKEPVILHRVTSYSGRYSVVLKAMNGQVLDRETHSRKTGLSSADGL